MKKKAIKLALVVLVGGLLVDTVGAQTLTPASLTSIGAPPTPGVNDVSQLVVGAVSQPPGLNYYFNNGWGAVSPGQTFTTGSNPNGYVLNTLSVIIPGDAGGLPVGGQAYYLRIFSVSDATNAVLLATYKSQTNFTFFVGDWLQFTNLTGVALKPNTQYAYSFANQIVFGAGYGNMGNLFGGGYYSGGQACDLPALGGPIVFNTDTGNIYEASFSVGLSPVTSLMVGPPVFTPVPPGNIITNGAAVTVSADVFGPGTKGYQWRTDGGSGGVLTNIPSATEATFSPNTASLAVGSYQYQVVVTNSLQVVTSTVATLSVTKPTAQATLKDVGTSITIGAFDVSQITGAGNGDGLNYYNNMGVNSGLYAGQTFTTGPNSQGYTLNTISIKTGDGAYAGDNSAFGANAYDLYVYAVAGSQATVLAHYVASGVTHVWQHWLQWTNLSLTLRSNTTYAYSFGINYTTGNPYEALGTSPNSTDLYTNGNLVLISPKGGGMVFGSSGKADAVFAVGLQPVGGVPAYPITSPIAISPASGNTAKGTTFTLSESVTGNPVLHYSWRTDGGSGGTLTNIPSSDASNLVVNTTANWKPGVYRYAVVVTNGSGSATSAVAAVTITYADTTATLTDLGATEPIPGAGDISQLVPGSGNPDGLNYYWNNTPAPGQTFTTGNSSGGYTMNSLSLLLAGGGPGWLGNDGGPETFVLRLYVVTNLQATLYATYTSPTYTTPPLFISTANQTDWIQWSGFGVPLTPNTTYAYTFYSDYGWDNLANLNGNLYPNGEVCTIPAAGGAVTLSSTVNYFDATFNIGLAQSASLTIEPSGGGQLKLQWSSGTLLQATNVLGPWTTNAATSPYTVTPTGAQKFYRIQIQ